MSTKKEKAAVLAEWLETIPDTHVACRDLRHQWTGEGSSWMLGHGFRGRILACRRCGVLKEQIIDKRGQISVSRMTGYPDDYVKPKEATEGRVPLVSIRDEMLRRSNSDEDAPEVLVAMFKRITGA